MKSLTKLLVLFFGVLMLANVTYAASPREQLKQMVEQLQKNPTDNALREKIIKLAQTIKPAPAVPDEAERRMMRGTAALEGVKSVAEYQNAAKEFEQATLAAPWYGDAYFNLGVAQDKAANYEAALRSLKLALLASPNDKEIKALIYKVEYRNDKANSLEAQAEKKKLQELEERRAAEELIRGLEGAIFAEEDKGWTPDYKQSHFMRVTGGHIESVNIQHSITQTGGRSYSKYCLCGDESLCNTPIGAEKVCGRSSQLIGRTAELRDGDYVERYEISKDGRELIITPNFQRQTERVLRYQRQ